MAAGSWERWCRCAPRSRQRHCANWAAAEILREILREIPRDTRRERHETRETAWRWRWGAIDGGAGGGSGGGGAEVAAVDRSNSGGNNGSRGDGIAAAASRAGQRRSGGEPARSERTHRSRAIMGLSRTCLPLPLQLTLDHRLEVVGVAGPSERRLGSG